MITKPSQHPDYNIVMEFVRGMRADLTLPEIRECLRKRLCSKSLSTLMWICEDLAEKRMVEPFTPAWGKNQKFVVIRPRAAYSPPVPLLRS